MDIRIPCVHVNWVCVARVWWQGEYRDGMSGIQPGSAHYNLKLSLNICLFRGTQKGFGEQAKHPIPSSTTPSKPAAALVQIYSCTFKNSFDWEANITFGDI